MLPYLSALTPQIAFTHTVREFIRELLKRFVPGKWIDRVISEDDATFDAKLDAALIGLDEKTATSKDYRASVVAVLCDEVSSICEVTRLVCINRGYRKYAETFLSTEKFFKMLLRQDFEKLERLNAVLDDKTKPLCDLLREIGAVLEDRPVDESAALGAAEAKKANAELKAIAADVKKTMQTGFAEVRGDIAAVGEKVDAVEAKVSKLRGNGKSRGRYDQEAKAVCWSCWNAAVNHEEVWRSVNTRITYEAVFKFYQGRLTKYGVNDCTEFRGIIRAEEKCRNRELQTRQDEARQKSAAKSNTKRGENSTMST